MECVPHAFNHRGEQYSSLEWKRKELSQSISVSNLPSQYALDFGLIAWSFEPILAHSVWDWLLTMPIPYGCFEQGCDKAYKGSLPGT